MARTLPAPAAKQKNLVQQNADFTSEGAPPPAVEAIPSVKTGAGTTAITPTRPKHRTSGRHRDAPATAKALKPQLPHDRDETASALPAVASEPMKQAQRDLARGLKDTDRGAEAGRTYQKLKH